MKKYLLPLHSNNGYAKAPQCYVYSLLPVLFYPNITERGGLKAFGI
jgi:hypothetical protein